MCLYGRFKLIGCNLNQSGAPGQQACPFAASGRQSRSRDKSATPLNHNLRIMSGDVAARLWSPSHLIDLGSARIGEIGFLIRSPVIIILSEGNSAVARYPFTAPIVRPAAM